MGGMSLTQCSKDAVSLECNYFLANIRYRSWVKSLRRYPERLKSYNEAMLKALVNEEIEPGKEDPKICKDHYRD